MRGSSSTWRVLNRTPLPAHATLTGTPVESATRRSVAPARSVTRRSCPLRRSVSDCTRSERSTNAANAPQVRRPCAASTRRRSSHSRSTAVMGSFWSVNRDGPPWPAAALSLSKDCARKATVRARWQCRRRSKSGRGLEADYNRFSVAVVRSLLGACAIGEGYGRRTGRKAGI